MTVRVKSRVKSRVQSVVFRRGWDRDTLSPMEILVLGRYAGGLRYKEIARERRVSRNTVKQHLAAARHKLNARSTTEACCIALRRGLIS